MRSVLKDISNLVSETPQQLYEKKRQYANNLVRRWAKTGLLEGLKNDYERHYMAMLLDNQAKQLLKEASMTGIAPGSEEWNGIALPIVRKVFGDIAAKEFLSVQAMERPNGIVFYLSFTHGTDQPGFSVGGEVYGVLDQPGQPTGGFYGAGRFAYSLNDYAYTVPSGSVSVTAGSSSVFDEFFREVDLVPELSASINNGTVKRVDLTIPLSLNADLDGIRGFRISAGSLTEAQNLPAYNKIVNINSINNTVTLRFYVFDSGNALTGPTNVNLRYQVSPRTLQGIRTDFEDRFGGPVDASTDIQIPEINMFWKQITLIAKTRKLKAVWTPEFSQDVQAYSNIYAEVELTAMLSEHVGIEIDLELLDMLIQNAPMKEYWSARIGEEVAVINPNSPNPQLQFIQIGNAGAFNREAWFRTLAQKVQKLSNLIHKKTMRGGANVMITSPDIATVFESLPGFVVDTDGSQMSFVMGAQKVGTFMNRFTVYKNPYMLENIILLAFKGQQFGLETGAVYAPYIPFILTPVVNDPNNFTPRKGLMTRYAKRMIRPEFYGKIVVVNPHLI